MPTSIRAVHLDLKGLPPTPARLVSLLPLFVAAGYNAILVEWEDAFPWTVDVRFRSETAYSEADVGRFLAEAQRLGLEVIPLVQCLGHLETPLTLPDYAHLREVPEKSDVLNPLAPGARELIERMIEDVLRLQPHARCFHLGGDEAWSFGTHPDTRAYIEQHGRGALYLRHVEPLLEELNARRIRPILWHDMMIHWDDASLQRLARQADLCVWGYAGHPDTTPHHYNTRHIQRFAGLGVTLWGATAYKGAEGHDADLPDVPARTENALAWAEIAGRFGMAGLIATAWSRYSTHRPQCVPIDAALDALVAVGNILESGQMPDPAVVASVLAHTGEAGRLQACRSAMASLSAARQAAWMAVAHLREQLVTSSQDPRRRGSGQELAALDRLRDALSHLDSIAADTRRIFTGLIHPLWLDRYLAERIEPIREELTTLAPRVSPTATR